MTTNTGKPLSLEKLLVKKDILKDVDVLAGIDRGCSLTKVVYVSKTSPEEDKYEMNLALFENQHFEKGLEWLKNEAILPDTGVLHVTGVGCDKFRDLIRQILNMEILHIHEFISLSKGSHFLLKHLDEKDYIYEEKETVRPKKNEMSLTESTKAVIERMKSKFRLHMEENSKFPSIFCFIGSTGGVIQINENGTGSMINCMTFSGKSFLGLSKIILQTSNYEEIMDLASKGNEANIDTTLGDVVSQNPNSPYGFLGNHDDFSIMPMGKAVDLQLNARDVKREDLASSLVGIFATVFNSIMKLAASATGVNTIYIGGNWAKNIVNGHTGSIGAMITNENDIKKFLNRDED